jgi:hypothetical protein
VWVGLAAVILMRVRTAGLVTTGAFARGGAAATALLLAWLIGGAAAPWVYAQPALGISEALSGSVQSQILEVVREQRVRGVVMILGGVLTMIAVLPLMGAVRSGTAALNERLLKLREES